MNICSVSVHAPPDKKSSDKSTLVVNILLTDFPVVSDIIHKTKRKILYTYYFSPLSSHFTSRTNCPEKSNVMYFPFRKRVGYKKSSTVKFPVHLRSFYNLIRLLIQKFSRTKFLKGE